MDEALALPGVELLPLSPAVAARAAGLPAGFAGDPADRLIAATALLESALLITQDARLQDAGFLRTVW